MKGSSFLNAPLMKWMMIGVIASSIFVSIADAKYLLPILVVPHLWKYKQFWRLAVWQFGYANSTEVLFAALTIHSMRLIERLWGTRKLASFIVCTFPYTTLLPPLLLALVIRPITLNAANYLPSGPTAVIFSILAQYYAAIPRAYMYRLYTTSKIKNPETAPRIILSDKTWVYIPAAQLALSQFPHNLLPAAIGWIVGYAYRSDILPGRATSWRLPSWIFPDLTMKKYEREMGLNLQQTGDTGEGMSSGIWPWSGRGSSSAGTGDESERERYQGLRRRLENESRAAAAQDASSSRPATSGEAATEAGGEQPLAEQIFERFRGRY
ncbi:hypothetical protein KEM54_003248 [Ascosphaera aggregata]|nr:hypothetical protein KEM54_003248 [Ascosphaera aggregata]